MNWTMLKLRISVSVHDWTPLKVWKSKPQREDICNKKHSYLEYQNILYFQVLFLTEKIEINPL